MQLAAEHAGVHHFITSDNAIIFMRLNIIIQY
jgi:hypothetical protein